MIVHDIREWICHKVNVQGNEVHTVQVEGIEREKIHKVDSGRQGSGRYRERKQEVAKVMVRYVASG
jgi:hypothetical protein